MSVRRSRVWGRVTNCDLSYHTMKSKKMLLALKMGAPHPNDSNGSTEREGIGRQ